MISEYIKDNKQLKTFEMLWFNDVLETFKILFEAEIQQTDQGYRLIGGVCPTQSP